MKQVGQLVLVGTPLGNRDDLSPRARRAMLSADLLLCEDTRSPLRLLGDTERLPPRLSCFAGNEADRVKPLLEALSEGKTVVFVSEAGMPMWSDPGRTLICAAIEAGYETDVIPGPTAATTALCHSGFSAGGSRFLGFPPRDGGARRRFLSAIVGETSPVVLYEAGNRVPALLTSLVESLGDASTRRCIVARELTKVHQQILRGTVADLAHQIRDPLRGEVTIVLDGGSLPPENPLQDHGRQVLEVMLSHNKPRERARKLSKLTGLDSQTIYARLVGQAKQDSQ